jgi:CelD/BcsL family acetyltransferase involved in cellulose biosynthesis
MDIKIFKTFPDELEGDWNSLLENSITHVPFMRFEYQQSWWQTLGGGEWKDVELYNIAAYQDGKLFGLAPLFYTPDYKGSPSMMLVGSIEVSDYLDLITSPSDLPLFIDTLFNYLSGPDLPPWKNLDFYNILNGSPTIPALEAAAAKAGWKFNLERLQHCPYIPLPGDWEKYLAGIDKKQRHEIRRKVRRLEEGPLPSRWYIVTDRETLDAEIDAFIEMMRQDEDKLEFLTPAMVNHMRVTTHCAFEQGCLMLAFLEINGEKAAGKLCFDYLNQIWAYNSGVNPKYYDMSPGWVLLAYLLKWANERNRSELDLMRGDEEYKYRFGGVDRFVMRATISRD